MDKQEAEKVLEYSDWWELDGDEMLLDGRFTLLEMEALVVLMKETQS